MARPARKGIDQLRTRVWCESVRLDLNLETAYELDEAFGTDTNRNWYKYRAGQRVPTHATLAAVERVCPGSRLVFEQGPQGVLLWTALAEPHPKLWAVIDVTFPEYQEVREKSGSLGIQQYSVFLERKLLPENYKSYIDFIEYSKGLKPNAIHLAYLRGEISVTPEIVATVIAFWRLSSVVFFQMLMADYLLSGVMTVLRNGKVFGSGIDRYLFDYLQKELPKQMA